MLLINISSDKVYLSDGQREELLDRNGIEDTLGPVLIDWQRTSPFQEIFLINGPGWFTNLRVGTLILNLLNAVNEEKIQIYSTDKLTLFAWLVDKRVLPPLGVIYLGQKSNVRIADFTGEEVCTTEAKLTDIPADAFLDEVYDPYRPNGNTSMLQFTKKKGKIFVTYQSKETEINIYDLKHEPVEQVQADYMIQPVLN